MAKIIVLFNPLSCNGNGEKSAHRLDDIYPAGLLDYRDITGISDYSDFFKNANEDIDVVICGGDGTLNRFMNATYDIPYANQILYFACGTGNDFLKDIGVEQGGKPVNITKYLRNLPIVTVNGKDYHFLNNVGFGIDGYCTQVGDHMRENHQENINYTAIAIKGLLGGFHPVNAVVTIDGVTKSYRKAWLVPTMKGRYYGGGMMPTPDQDRNSADGAVSVMVFKTASKMKALIVFPSIFQGEHVKHEKMVEVMKGHNIKVKFDRPCALQIDGETIPDVTEYEVRA